MLQKALFCLLIALLPGFGSAGSPATNLQLPAAPGSDIDRLVQSSAASPRLHSLLVSQGGNLIYERYFNGYGPDDLNNVKSVSKSVLSALVGIAIANDYINGVDARMDEYFGDELGDVDESAAAKVSIENLLTMQAGLSPTSNRNYGAWVQSENWIHAALEMPMQGRPGGEMLYSTGNTHLLSAIITRATGKSTLEFARQALAEPLDFKLAPWQRDPQGIYFGGNNMLMTPRQMLAFGELYLNGGRVGDRQVVPEDWVRASLAPHARSPHGTGRYYGYGWWVCDLAGFVVPHAWGHGGQFIMLVPALDLVLVTTSGPGADASAHDHANKVYALLQHMIHAVDSGIESGFQYANNRAAPNLH